MANVEPQGIGTMYPPQTVPKLTGALMTTAVLMFLISAFRIISLIILVTTTSAPGLSVFGFFMNLFFSALCIYEGYLILKRRKSAFSGGITILVLMIAATLIMMLIAGLDLTSGWDISTLAAIGVMIVTLIMVIVQRKYFIVPDPKKGGFQKQPPFQPPKQ